MTEQEMWDDDDRTIKSLIGIPDWLDADRWENKGETFNSGRPIIMGYARPTGCGWLRDHGPLTPAAVAAINQGGCDSGAFMPAVTYWSAKAAMNSWGDEILAYIEDRLGDVPAPDDKNRSSWGTLACFYVSVAVELWASDTLAALEDVDTETAYAFDRRNGYVEN